MSTLHENKENIDKMIKDVINDMNVHKKEINEVKSSSIRVSSFLTDQEAFLFIAATELKTFVSSLKIKKKRFGWLTFKSQKFELKLTIVN